MFCCCHRINSLCNVRRSLLFGFCVLQHPKETLGGWRNQVCARVGALVGMYSPIKALPQVRSDSGLSDNCALACLHSYLRVTCGTSALLFEEHSERLEVSLLFPSLRNNFLDVFGAKSSRQFELTAERLARLHRECPFPFWRIPFPSLRSTFLSSVMM